MIRDGARQGVHAQVDGTKLWATTEARWEITVEAVVRQVEDAEVGQVAKLRGDDADQAKALQVYGGNTTRVPTSVSGHAGPSAENRWCCAVADGAPR